MDTQPLEHARHDAIIETWMTPRARPADPVQDRISKPVHEFADGRTLVFVGGGYYQLLAPNGARMGYLRAQAITLPSA